MFSFPTVMLTSGSASSQLMRPLYGSLLLCQVVGKNAHKLLIVRGMASAEMVSPFSRRALLIPAAIYSTVTCTPATVSGSDTRSSGFACSREVPENHCCVRIDSGVLPQALTFSACLSFQTLKEAFAAKIPVWQSEIKDIKKLYGDKVLGTCTVEQVLVCLLFPRYISRLYISLRFMRCNTYVDAN